MSDLIRAKIANSKNRSPVKTNSQIGSFYRKFMQKYHCFIIHFEMEWLKSQSFYCNCVSGAKPIAELA